MSHLRSLQHLSLASTLLFGASLIAVACSSDALPLGHDQGTGGRGDDGGGSGGASGGSGGSGTGGSVETCPVSACGPQLGIANFTCSDGSLGGPTGRCLSKGNGVCVWEIRVCPTGEKDGGASTGDGGTTDPCSNVVAAVHALIAAHQSCTVNDDCQMVRVDCLPNSFCTGAQYVNHTVQQSDFADLQRELNACTNGDPSKTCSECKVADRNPACVNHLCGPVPLGQP